MDLNDTQSLVTFLAGLGLVIGIFGIIIPMLPGLVLCWLSVLGWAIFSDAGWGKWVVLAIATVLALLGVVVKYAWPGRNLKRTGVPNRSIIIGGLLGLVGFFVIPFFGLFIGFVIGVFVAERMRLEDNALAWPSTKAALKAVGLAMLVELTSALAIAGTWLIGLAAT